jgi:hypothetical protein
MRFSPFGRYRTIIKISIPFDLKVKIFIIHHGSMITKWETYENFYILMFNILHDGEFLKVHILFKIIEFTASL